MTALRQQLQKIATRLKRHDADRAERIESMLQHICDEIAEVNARLDQIQSLAEATPTIEETHAGTAGTT